MSRPIVDPSFNQQLEDILAANNLSLIVGGFAGQGVNTVGNTFARLCSRSGLHVFVNLEYPSNIRGEHNYAQVVVSEKPVGGHSSTVDLLLALDGKSVNLHTDEVKPGGAIILDRSGFEVSGIDAGLEVRNIDRDDITIVDIPFKQIVEDTGGAKMMINSVGLGAVSGLVNLNFDLLSDMLRESLSKYDQEIVDANIECARNGYELARDEYSDKIGLTLEKREASPRMLVTGNHAVAFGALKAGIKFYAAYPMSPSSGVLSYLSKHASNRDLVVVQPEDEIAAAGMAIGASFAGVRAMTGTSGGGFCLMSEYLGMAGMAEIPLVILEAQRPGPATGLPTRTEQGDLNFVLSAHQGDFSRIVVAPGDPEEAFYLTFDAFNLADKYQTPVIVLSDKHLAESAWSREPFDTEGMIIDRGEILSENDLSKIGDYKRFLVTDSGISPRVLPGTPGGVFRATGNEHDEFGLISEDAGVRGNMMEKRSRKTASFDVSEIGIKLHGDAEAEITIVGWGSTKPVILEAMSKLNEISELNVNFLQIVYMEPFPVQQVASIIGKAKRVVLIENNATGQLGKLISQKTGMTDFEKILKYNGRQFFVDELVDNLREKLSKPKSGIQG